MYSDLEAFLNHEELRDDKPKVKVERVEPAPEAAKVEAPKKEALVVKRVFVPKGCDVPIFQKKVNIFDPTTWGGSCKPHLQKLATPQEVHYGLAVERYRSLVLVPDQAAKKDSAEVGDIHIYAIGLLRVYRFLELGWLQVRDVMKREKPKSIDAAHGAAPKQHKSKPAEDGAEMQDLETKKRVEVETQDNPPPVVTKEARRKQTAKDVQVAETQQVEEEELVETKKAKKKKKMDGTEMPDPESEVKKTAVEQTVEPDRPRKKNKTSVPADSEQEPPETKPKKHKETVGVEAQEDQDLAETNEVKKKEEGRTGGGCRDTRRSRACRDQRGKEKEG